MHDKLLLFSKFLISPRLTERESRAICRGAFAPKKQKQHIKFEQSSNQYIAKTTTK